MTQLTLQFVDPRRDPWRKLEGEDGPISHPSPAPHRLLTLAQWHAVRDTWPADVPAGVVFPNDVDIETLVDDLPRLALVELQFPKWSDGRAYSQAHLLRARWRYTGIVRASAVLVDMLPMLARTGFSEVLLRADQDPAAAERALQLFPAYYQGDVKDSTPWFLRRLHAGAAGSTAATVRQAA